MQGSDSSLSTGLVGLDRIFRGLIAGDNIVWQVDGIEDYKFFVGPYCQYAKDRQKPLIYFRFAGHEPLVEPGPNVQIHELKPENGFESFIDDIHQVIRQNGRGGYYVFDCLSSLADIWYSDQMLGNFFMLTCPYLFDIEAIAYFAVYRNYHSYHATGPIVNTTQVFCNVYQHQGRVYVHPIKVQQRYSAKMYMLHVWDGQEFPAVTHSATISEVLTSVPWSPKGASTYEQGVWSRALQEAQEVQSGKGTNRVEISDQKALLTRLVHTIISRDDRVSKLVEQYFSIEDVLKISKRMVGTGLIGGKSVGMLLARAILEHDDDHWKEVLEPHDSFYIGSDVFYTFLVENGIWWERERQKDREHFLDGLQRSRHRTLVGTFPEYIEKQLCDILDYFGQSPFIVRSSSLLEDNFGNAFAGKYDSVFCVNQGPRDKRLEDFKAAIRTIYASSMSDKALIYRQQRELLEHDEQMALLVQRVSGGFYGELFMPQTAGVGFSYNPYVWSETIDPKAGVVRLVFGLGTRAVDRNDDDYTRVVALNEPKRRPESNRSEEKEYTQHKIDVLDLEASQLASLDLEEVLKRAGGGIPIELFASKDRQMEERARQQKMTCEAPWVLTFDAFLGQTGFVGDMRQMLGVLQKAYDYPVDVEFTCNFYSEKDYKINVVQCRPFQVKVEGTLPDAQAGAMPEVADEDVVLKAHGAVIGQSRVSRVDRFVYVVPGAYGKLPIQDRYAVARQIGRLMHVEAFHEGQRIMLLGPGRWGTTSPELGVPISFSEISTVSALCEIVAMRDDLVPDVSLGTHLFSELVEMDILYLALFPHQQGNTLSELFFEKSPNQLGRFMEDADKWEHVLRVVEPGDGTRCTLHANTLKQKVVCYLEEV